MERDCRPCLSVKGDKVMLSEGGSKAELVMELLHILLTTEFYSLCIICLCNSFMYTTRGYLYHYYP